MLRGLADLRNKKAQTLSRDELQEWKNYEKQLKQEFKLEVFLKVSQARGQGLISMKNLSKMDDKISSQVQKYACQITSSESMKHKMETESKG